MAALRPGGPLGDMQSHNEYATEVRKERQGQQQPEQQSESRQLPQEREEPPKRSQQELDTVAFEKNLAENASTGQRNDTDRADKLGYSQQSQSEAKPEKTDEQIRKEANEAMAQKLADSSFSRGLELDRQNTP